MSFIANGKHDGRAHNIRLDKTADWPEPDPFEKLNWLIHLQHVRGQVSSCKELIKYELAKSCGHNEYALFKQGVILREDGKIQDALDAFQTNLKLNPENTENLKEVGRCLYEMRRFRLSLDAYKEAERITKIPDWQIYHNIGECLIRLGECELAKEYAKLSVQFGKHEVAYALLIKTLKNEGDLKGAITVCKSAIESCPDSVALLCECGLLYLTMGDNQHGFERLSSALALDPFSYKALLGIGCITQSHGEPDVALNKFKLAVHYEPNSAALWNNIGLCFHSKQKYIAAISCLKRALWISPLNWRVLFNLGLVHLATCQPASAFNFLCAAVNLRPDFGQSFNVLGCALLELKDPDNGQRALLQACSLSPDDPNVALNTAVCLLADSEQSHQFEEQLNRFQSLIAGQENNLPKEIVDLAGRLAVFLTFTKTEQRDVIEGTNDPVTSYTKREVNVKGTPEKGNITSDNEPDYIVSRRMEPDEV